jgi:hypothetical protein
MRGRGFELANQLHWLHAAIHHEPWFAGLDFQPSFPIVVYRQNMVTNVTSGTQLFFRLSQ